MYKLEKLFFSTLLITVSSFAAENGVSVYPAGVETILPGLLPPSGKTLLLEFNNYYDANAVVDGNGHSLVPGFHLRVAAFAPKVVHNWGVKALGGELVSSAAAPLLYEHLNAPFGRFAKTGLGNPDLGVLAVAYNMGPVHWWYGFDVYTPAPQYNKNDVLNIGQHYFATAPEGAISYVPNHGKTELSSKIQYIVNYQNPATGYRSGREFVVEYAAMQNVTKKLSIGVNGFSYRQTSDDLQNGVIVESGNRGQSFGIGPQIKYHFSHAAMILKYQKELMVANRARGNSVWLQIGIPLWGHEH